VTAQATRAIDDSTPPRRRAPGFGLPLALALAVLGFVVGAWIGQLAVGGRDYVTGSDNNDAGLLLGYVFSIVGFFVGLGFANYPVSRLLGRPPVLPEEESTGWRRYYRLSTDHKVIGIQYIVGTLFFFFVGGLNAMFIRAELLSARPTLWTSGQYISLVGLHGTMMIIMMSAAVVGPFGNYLVPLMIGARGTAFPRVEALTFWLVPPAGIVLLSSTFLGGFPTGWTGYGSLADEARLGMDAYLVAFALIALSLMLTGLNFLVTVMTMRAPGLTYNRLPIFVWGVLGTAVLMALASPMLLSALLMSAMDRSMNTTFFLPKTGGTPFLWENLFWFFGHPEVYILALPGFGIVLEILPVFARKPLWGYRLAVAGIVGVTLLSFMVWQHHLFVSGINSDLRPFFMLTTELISIPTSFIFLNAMGTLWRGRIRFTVPMLFCLAFFFNFLVGGITGVWLSNVPSDVTTHGSYFVMAHFHYTIMGGLVFAMMAAFYYWIPKMTGYMLDERLGKLHFWMMFVFFNSTFLPLFAVGMLGMPRRVSTYPENLHALNVWVSVSAFLLGTSMLVFLINLVWSLIFARVSAPENPWRSRGLEWLVPTPVPAKNFEQIPTILAGPYGYGDPEAAPVAVLASAGTAPAGE
jgi:cytochrome c oxidase subunit 1